MVAGKRIHCVICNKKCSGNVLRYQDQYYHKQCFELEQSQGGASAGGGGGGVATGGHYKQQQELDHHQDPYHDLHSADSISLASRRGQQQQQQQQQVNTSQSSLTLPSTSTMRSSRLLGGNAQQANQQSLKSQTLDRPSEGPNVANTSSSNNNNNNRSATLPHSTSVPANGFLASTSSSSAGKTATCAGCRDKIKEGQSLIALDQHWHVWCFKCAQCQVPLHAEYVAKDGKAYCEKDYQKLFGVACVYCKRYITGKVLQAGEAHHFHPSCARCSKCGDPFVPGEEMYLQGEVTWHPRCGPGPQLGDQNSADDQLTSGSQLRASRGQSPSLSSRSQSRSASPFSFMSRQYGRSSPGYADSEAVGDLSRIYTISYLNADPTQGYLRRPIEPQPPKSPQFSRPASVSRLGAADNRSRSSTRSHHYYANAGGPGSHLSRDRSVPRGLYSVLSGSGRGSQLRARSPSMMKEEAIQLAAYPSGQKPSPGQVPPVERDDFPAPPFPVYASRSKVGGGGAASSASGGRESVAGETSNEPNVVETRQERQQQQQQQQQQRRSRPKSREIVLGDEDDSDSAEDTQLKKEEEELSKIANGIGKIFLQTLKEREKLRAWKRANLDPRNASRTPSATRELHSRPLRYDNPTNASPSRDMDRPRVWDELDGEGGGDQSPTRTKSSLGLNNANNNNNRQAAPMSPSAYGYKVVQSNRFTPRPGYGLQALGSGGGAAVHASEMSFNQRQSAAQSRSGDLLRPTNGHHQHHHHHHHHHQSELMSGSKTMGSIAGTSSSGRHHHHHLHQQPPPLAASAAHLRRSMPNVSNLAHHQHYQHQQQHHIHLEGPPKLYPYHLLATSNYRLPPDVDRCHLERHLSNEEFQYIFHCDRLDFYRLPEWKRNELKRRAKLF